MTREEAKDLALSILVIVVALLIADCIWLHVKCAGMADGAADLGARLEAHINPPQSLSSADKAMNSYERAKAATVKQYQKIKSAASAGYRAAKDKYNTVEQ